MLHPRRSAKCALAALISLPFVVLIAGRGHRSAEIAQRGVEARVFSAGPVATTQVVERREKIYPYSVVPGGVHNVQDFERKPDRVARAHYRGLHATAVLRNARDEFWYVSFRKGNSIFWTRRKLRVPAGEMLLKIAGSKDIEFARTRCGNLLSYTPQRPVLSERQEQPIVEEGDHEVPDAPTEMAIAVPPILDQAPGGRAALVSEEGNRLLASAASGFPWSPDVFSAAEGGGGGLVSSGSGAKAKLNPKPVPPANSEARSTPEIEPDPNSAATVPEPAAVCLVFCGVAWLLLRRRRAWFGNVSAKWRLQSRQKVFSAQAGPTKLRGMANV